eukprot:CAMPEP_0170506354 /NCGR_PEP_ID=MMETSP0208-20121228/54580_1 /TAXON_ID=197538 /ORGANISM="Strombidium inclinatum, Strain S3" /LENGTH=130 /DNA_ID=CAMNT_0010787817 /DNA_START=1993 /DNA_END=2385 /DNA_ORIENTATION=-
MALDNAAFYLQLTFCETTFLHRFVHFEVDTDYIEQFEPILNEYIEGMKSVENDGILHYHLQEMPTKRQLDNMDPKHFLNKQTKPKGKKAKPLKKRRQTDNIVKDLDGNIVDQPSPFAEEEDDDFYGLEDD